MFRVCLLVAPVTSFPSLKAEKPSGMAQWSWVLRELRVAVQGWEAGRDGSGGPCASSEFRLILSLENVTWRQATGSWPPGGSHSPPCSHPFTAPSQGRCSGARLGFLALEAPGGRV